MLSEEILSAPTALWRLLVYQQMLLRRDLPSVWGNPQEEGPKFKTGNAALEYLDYRPASAIALLSNMTNFSFFFFNFFLQCWLIVHSLLSGSVSAFCSVHTLLHCSRAWLLLDCGMGEGLVRKRRASLPLLWDDLLPWHCASSAGVLETCLCSAPPWLPAAQLENTMRPVPELSLSELCSLSLANNDKIKFLVSFFSFHLHRLFIKNFLSVFHGAKLPNLLFMTLKYLGGGVPEK